ncbi:conserved hypothetical protein, partial [Brucella pinnipedialis M163/99/10]
NPQGRLEYRSRTDISFSLYPLRESSPRILFRVREQDQFINREAPVTADRIAIRWAQVMDMEHISHKTFVAPQSSRSTRHISPRSKASLRGTLIAQLPADDHPRRIVFESKLEQRVLHLLLACRNVHDIWDQPPFVTYRNAEGKQKRHVFDFLATLKNGRRVAIAVKPSSRAKSRSFRRELQYIRTGTSLAFAHDVVLMTDQSFTVAAARNAARLHEFRRTPDPDADEHVRLILSKLDCAVTVGGVVARSELQGRGFRAVFRAIYDGYADRLGAGDIDLDTLLMARGAM